MTGTLGLLSEAWRTLALGFQCVNFCINNEPSRPSEADQFAARISDAVFGHHWDDHSPLERNGGNGSGNGQ